MMSNLPEEPKAVRDYFKYNFAANQAQLADARERYRATLDRRDGLLDKMRFGALSLNGVTLLAGLSELAEDFTLNPWSLSGTVAVCLFVLGIVLSMLSMNREHLHLIGLASEQGLRVEALKRVSATLEGEISPSALARLEKEMDQSSNHLPKDHTLDPWSFHLMQASAVCWFVGLVVGLAGA